MILEGTLTKDGKLWMSDIPFLDLQSQGKTRKEASKMASSAIKDLIDKRGFKTKAIVMKGNKFGIKVDDIKPVIALFLQRMRMTEGLTLDDMRKRLRNSSNNAYAQYEQGRALPSIELLNKFVSAMTRKHDLDLSFSIISA